MTLSEVVAATCARFGLTSSERMSLTEAVVAYVDDGQLAAMPDAPGLAQKLGEVTLFRVAHRIVVEWLSCERSAAPEPAEQELERVSYQGRVVLRKRKACSFCRAPGHQMRTCPQLR